MTAIDLAWSLPPQWLKPLELGAAVYLLDAAGMPEAGTWQAVPLEDGRYDVVSRSPRARRCGIARSRMMAL